MTTAVVDTVRIWTKSGGCTRQGPTEVTSEGLVVTIRVFDSVLVHAPRDYGCPDIERFGRRAVAIRFSQPGLGVVRVVGADTTTRRVLIR